MNKFGPLFIMYPVLYYKEFQCNVKYSDNITTMVDNYESVISTIIQAVFMWCFYHFELVIIQAVWNPILNIWNALLVHNSGSIHGCLVSFGT